MSKKVNEPIAIVGMACRFPGGGHNPEQFWNVLEQGIDGIIDVPKDRWDARKFYDENSDRAGKSHAKQAGFLQMPVDQFDPLFFGISPREASVLDPQQRMLLEMTWEAVEDAGIKENNLRGSETGVFIGGFCLDNKLIQLGQLNREFIGSLTPTSSTMVMLSNRISYSFDLRGPSLTIDTACSSSLVAAHYACQSIWNGESEMAITGGINTMLTPEYPITMSKGKFLSKHSRCKAFDADAGGYVRGEGGGVIVLKPLSKAIADKDYIYALVRATGANQDGQTNGITVPNPEAQAKLIKKVYKEAGVQPSEVQYVEAHGTGTKAGDPVEISALNEALSEGRAKDDKAFVGSVKTNIGHLEAGAGIAGVIKATLSINKKKIAPNLHFNNPNPAIDFENACVQVSDKLRNWPKGKDNRYASINSFGYGGTNGHVLLQNAPDEQPNAPIYRNGTPPSKHLRLFPFSAKGDDALKAVAQSYVEKLENESVNVDDLLYSLAHRRSAHRNRLVIAADNITILKENLKAWSDGQFLQGVVNDVADTEEKQKIVFVYTGMGPQWWAMGRELLEENELFRSTVEECDEIFKGIAGWSILEELLAPEESSRMAETQIAQPANFVIQAGLTALWNSWGIHPDAVVGHSVGEVASAYVSGALSLEDALLVSFHRSRIQQKTAGQGTMLAIGMGEEEALELIAPFDDVSVAAINSFNAITLAGNEETLKLIGEGLTEQNVFNKMLRVEVAYHSYQMDPLKEELLACLASVEARDPQIPLYSTVTGQIVEGKQFGTDYWWDNVRQPVRFAKTISTIIGDGYANFLEVGPHPVTRVSISECLADAGVSGKIVSSLRRKDAELANLYESLATLHTIGFDLDWDTLAPQGNYIKLPAYPWQRSTYWYETERSKEERIGNEGHVFLNANMRQQNPTWEVEINQHYLPWMEDHQVENMVVIPGAAYVEAGLALHEKIFGETACTLQNLEFNQVLVVDSNKVQMLNTSFDAATKTYAVHSRDRGDNPSWTLHAKGRMLEQSVMEATENIDVAAIRKAVNNEIIAADLYKTLTDRGLVYGPHFQGLKEIYTAKDQVFVKIEALEEFSERDNYILHPTILDAAFQSMVAIVDGDDANPNPFVPVAIEKLTLFEKVGASVYCHGQVTERGSDVLKGDLVFFTEEGKVVFELKGLTCRAISNAVAEEETVSNDWFYELAWHKVANENEVAAPSKYLFIGEQNELNNALIEKLGDVVPVNFRNDFAQTENGFTINPQDATQWETLVEAIKANEIAQIIYSTNDTATTASVDGVLDANMPVVYLANALSNKNKDQQVRLTVLTNGAQIVREQDELQQLNAAPLWGLASVVANEYPWIDYKLIDITGSLDKNVDAVAHELLSNDSTTEVAFRAGKRYIKQLEREEIGEEEASTISKSVSVEELVELKIGSAGRIESLYHEQQALVAPKADEIQVKVHAASINFKDLLKVLGQISAKVIDGTYFGNTFGMECSGVITAVGKDITEHKVGDEIVVATPNGCFSSYVTVKPQYFIPKSKNVSFDEAPVTIPYMTVIHGLINKADVMKGEKVLIHNGTGAVGQAAIQVAKWRGAEIYTTAGTEEKRAYLKAQGLTNIYNSRDLAFTEEILRDTNGYGVDVVLNAIAGEALYQSFKLLAPYGRFVEIGKRDIGENTGLPMNVFNRNISFTHIDIDRIMQEREPLAKSLLDKVYKGFEEGYLKPFPVKVFQANEAIDAYSFVRKSQHIGKVVISYAEGNVEVEEKVEQDTFDLNGTYVITGGTGGFGLEIAKHLTEKGVEQLLLLSRSGDKKDSVKAAIKAMEAKGTKVYAPAADISNLEVMKDIFADAKNRLAPIKGIFHGAMVLDDGFLMDMDRSRFNTVVNPKVQGALNLHEVSKDIDLDFFISFSSISSVIGNAGQSNYVAANAFLDAFAHFRRSQGLKATTINLGVLSQVGVVARNADVGHLLEGAGIKGFSTQMALEAIEAIIRRDNTQVGLFDINWKKWGGGNPKAGTLFNELINSDDANSELSEEMIALIGTLSAMDEESKQLHVEGLVSNVLAQVLKMSADKIDVTRGVNFLGIDSLLAVELERGITASTGVEISTMEILSGPSVQQLAKGIIDKLPSIELSAADDELIENLDNLSEAELDAMLESVS